MLEQVRMEMRNLALGRAMQGLADEAKEGDAAAGEPTPAAAAGESFAEHQNPEADELNVSHERSMRDFQPTVKKEDE